MNMARKVGSLFVLICVGIILKDQSNKKRKVDRQIMIISINGKAIGITDCQRGN